MILQKKKIIQNGVFCPICRKTGVRIELNSITGEVLLVCSNKAHSLYERDYVSEVVSEVLAKDLI